MREASELGKKSSTRREPFSGDEFEETFKPKAGNINAGFSKSEKSKKKKKQSKNKGLIIGLILFLLIAGSGAILYFTGILTPILQSMGIVEASTTGISNEELQVQLEQWETDLNAREESLNAWETQLSEQEAALQTESSTTEDVITFEETLSEMSEEKLTELKRVGTIYSNMDPTAAAAIMEQVYDETEISIIIYHMQPSASALVLAQMDADLAARVTANMLS